MIGRNLLQLAQSEGDPNGCSGRGVAFLNLVAGEGAQFLRQAPFL